MNNQTIDLGRFDTGKFDYEYSDDEDGGLIDLPTRKSGRQSGMKFHGVLSQ